MYRQRIKMFIIFSCHIIIDYGILTVNLYSSGSTSEGIYMTRKQELKDIETELSGYVKTDQRNWIRIYQLMNKVQEEELYRERIDTPTFTIWVQTLARDLHVHVSLLWKRLKAGRVYHEYEIRAAKKNRTVPTIDQLENVSPDSLSLCESVAGSNTDQMDRLIDGVVNRELTRTALREAVKAKRACGTPVAHNGNDRTIISQMNIVQEDMTAEEIIQMLQSSIWLPRADRPNYIPSIYKVFPEFRANTGSTRHVRRMDALIVDNVTDPSLDHLTLRCIEIKVSREDLVKEKKVQEYAAFADYLYLCVPRNDVMIEAAGQILMPEWGLITASRTDGIEVIKEPKKTGSMFREETLSNVVIKLLQGS